MCDCNAQPFNDPMVRTSFGKLLTLLKIACNLNKAVAHLAYFFDNGIVKIRKFCIGKSNFILDDQILNSSHDRFKCRRSGAVKI